MIDPVRSVPKADSEHVRLETSEWLLRRERGLSMSERAEYEAWLAAQPDHLLAVAEAAYTWDALGDLISQAEVIDLRRAALARVSRLRVMRRASLHRWKPAFAAAAAALVVVVGGVAVKLVKPPVEIFETAAGEVRTVTLSDGSKLSMDHGTRVSVRYDQHSRDIVLMQGQAEFEVAKNRSRPFSVEAAGRRVIATGTDFVVDMLPATLAVTLIEGHVSVAPANGGGESFHLSPAERLTVDCSSGAVQRVRVDPADAMMWKSGKLIFDREPLAAAAARVNRYGGPQIAIVDKRMADETISGVFNIGDSKAFAEAVAAQLPLRAESDGSGRILLLAP